MGAILSNTVTAIQCTEKMVGENHPTYDDTLNRLALVQHDDRGNHTAIYATDPTQATSATAAANIFLGGVGIVRDLYIGGSLYTQQDITGDLIGNVTGDVTGNASTATNADKLDNHHAADFLLKTEFFLWQGVVTDGNSVGDSNATFNIFGSTGFNTTNCKILVNPIQDGTLYGFGFAGGDHNASLTEYTWSYIATKRTGLEVWDIAAYTQWSGGWANGGKVSDTKVFKTAAVTVIGVK